MPVVFKGPVEETASKSTEPRQHFADRFVTITGMKVAGFVKKLLARVFPSYFELLAELVKQNLVPGADARSGCRNEKVTLRAKPQLHVLGRRVESCE